jgi:hypothetical protein
MNEGELARHEAVHVCDPMRLYQLHLKVIPQFLPESSLA